MDEEQGALPGWLRAPFVILRDLVPETWPLYRLALPTQVFALTVAYLVSRWVSFDPPPIACPVGLYRGLTILVTVELCFLAGVFLMSPLAKGAKLPGYVERLLAALRKTHAKDLVLTCATVGLVEEAVFRGFLAAWIGIWPAAVLFAAAHRPRSAFHWVALGSLGVLFGYEVVWTGGLLIPIMHHALHDLGALTLLAFALRRDEEGERSR